MFAILITLIVAALHGYFLWLEMFRWEAPRTRKVFGTDAAFATASKTLAANQGLYNGFLAVGLVLGLLISSPVLVIYLLWCVVVAGIYGGMTVSPRVYFVQALPALLAVALTYLGK